MRKGNLALVLALVAVLSSWPHSAVSAPLVAQDDDSEVGSLPEEASDFDFWIGTWRVGSSATDKVKRFGKGVAILETYTNGANKGWSVNTFDVTTKMWTQTWHTNTGTYFQVTGKKDGNKIVLVGKTKNPQNGAVGLLRLSFVNITESSFDQQYDLSTDDGKTWSPLSTVPFRRMQ